MSTKVIYDSKVKAEFSKLSLEQRCDVERIYYKNQNNPRALAELSIKYNISLPTIRLVPGIQRGAIVVVDSPSVSKPIDKPSIWGDDRQGMICLRLPIRMHMALQDLSKGTKLPVTAIVLAAIEKHLAAETEPR